MNRPIDVSHPNRRAQVSLATTSLLVLNVWTILVVCEIASGWTDRRTQTLLAFTLATAVVLRFRLRRRDRIRFIPFLLALAGGYVSYSAWVAVITVAGLGIGLPAGDVSLGQDADTRVWVSSVVLAPLFEEFLYREQVLLTVRGAWGTVAAIVISSAAFAIPHFGWWSMLGTFLVGAAIGCVMVAGRSVWVCIAAHAGLNLAALVHGTAGASLDVGIATSFFGGLVLILAALLHLGARPCRLLR